jgi:RNA polymerase sigma-70 factor, ECF subfamily
MRRPQYLPATMTTLPSDESTDQQLAQRLGLGEAEAFDLLLRRYQDRVMRIVFSILPDPMDREETVQDVFVAVFKKIAGFRGDSSLSTWIHRIAVNTALMRRRRYRPERTIEFDEALLPAFEANGHIAVDIRDWSDRALDPALAGEARRLIQSAVDRLDEKYQSVFVLRDIEGLSTQETAEALELNIPAVKSRLHRARLYLRRELAAYFDRDTDL